MQEFLPFLNAAPLIATLLASLGTIIGALGLLFSNLYQKRKQAKIIYDIVIESNGTKVRLRAENIDYQQLKEILDKIGHSPPESFVLKVSDGTREKTRIVIEETRTRSKPPSNDSESTVKDQQSIQ